MNKLIRDKIPEIIRASGKQPNVYIETDSDKIFELLRDKLIEEANEVKNAKDDLDLKYELADVYEVFKTLVNYCGYTTDHIMKLAEDKKQLRGGFDIMYVLKQED